MLCGHLDAEDVARLICVASWGSAPADREALWRAYFIVRWGKSMPITGSTVVHVLGGWFDEGELFPPILSVGFCARSAVDHLFWFLPYTRVLKHDAKGATHHPSQLFAWQLASRAHARFRGLVYCSICDVLEVAPPGPVPLHFRRRWARPCKCAAKTSHLRCLEKHIMQALSTQRGEASLRCSTCGMSYRISSRFPETMRELCRASVKEWKWVMQRTCMTIVFFFWLLGIAYHYCGDSGIGSGLYPLVFMTATMISISLSPRFHRSVRKVWNTPQRSIYLRLFCFVAVLNYMVTMRALAPGQWLAFARQGPVLSAIHQLHTLSRETWVGSAVMAFMSGVYALTASGVIFCFWKTSLRVPTIADAEDAPTEQVDTDRPQALLQRSFAPCGLCQLGLCLDNPCR